MYLGILLTSLMTLFQVVYCRNFVEVITNFRLNEKHFNIEHLVRIAEVLKIDVCELLNIKPYKTIYGVLVPIQILYDM